MAPSLYLHGLWGSGSARLRALAAGSSTGISNFIVQRGTDGSTFTTLTSTLAGTVTQFTDSTAAAGTKYYYQVLAVNSFGTSPASSVVSATNPSANASRSGTEFSV